jgi:FSR family fosmidomycin resistance protein-like MFS transporter
MFFQQYLRRAAPRAPTQADEAREAPETQPRGSRRLLIIFLILSTFTGATFISVISMIPLYLVDRFGVSAETAGAFLGLIYSSGLWVGPVAGHLSDRFGRIPALLTMCFLSGPMIALLNVVEYGWGLFVFLFLLGVVIYVRMPVSESFVVANTPPQNRSTVLGLYFFGSMEGGGLLTPALGYLIDRVGFVVGFTVAGAALFLVTVLCAAGLKKERGQ